MISNERNNVRLTIFSRLDDIAIPKIGMVIDNIILVATPDAAITVDKGRLSFSALTSKELIASG